MSQAETLRIAVEGSFLTVGVPPDELNRIETARQVSWQLAEVMQALQATSDQNLRLNLDMGNVNWLSSAGLNELIGIKSNARNHGVRLVLLNVLPQVRDVFALTRLERMFEFDESDAEVTPS